MGVDHGGTRGKSPQNLEKGDASANCPPQICVTDTKGAFCGLQNTPKSVFGRALPRTPLGELTTLPRPPSWLERGHDSPYPTPFGTDPPSVRAMRPLQNSSQIYAYAAKVSCAPNWRRRWT